MAKWSSVGRQRRRTAKFERLIVVVVLLLLTTTSQVSTKPREETKRKAKQLASPVRQHVHSRLLSPTCDGANNRPLVVPPSEAEATFSDSASSESSNGTAAAAAAPMRWKRAAQSAELMRVVAVSGQWIELQCPLVSELMPAGQNPASVLAPTQAPANLQQSQEQLYSIQWRKNGVRLDQLNPRYKINLANGSLVIANSQPKVDEANYECWLVRRQKKDQPEDDSDAEPLKSHRLELRLLVQPRVAPFEFPADAQVGMKLVLTCSTLEGQQPISFVWLKDNKIIAADEQRPTMASTAQANSLSQLHQQQLADKYALSPIPYSLARSGYKAEYLLTSNSSSSSSSKLIESPTTSRVDEQQQQTALLPLLSDSNIRVRQSDDYSILSIDKLELKHSGRYTCSVQNEAARTSHSSQLLINAPPTLTIVPKDVDLVSGQSAVIECAASGQPRPSLSWLRARESSSKQWDYVPIYDNLRYTSLSNGSLAIGNITQREQGFYLCSAKNPFGTEMSKLAKISVHEPAKFATKYKTLEVRIEESGSLLCAATGELPLTIEWLSKEEIPIQANDKRFIIDRQPQDLKPAELMMANATISRLIVAKSQRSDSGHYSCHARNKFGSDKMVTNLLVQDVPDKVTDLKVTNTTASSIFLRWQLAFSGNSPITSYLVQYEFDNPLDELLVSMGTNNNQQQQQQSRSRDDHLDSAAGSGDKSSIGGGASSSSSPLKVALEALSVAAAGGSSLDSAASLDDAFDRTLIEQTVEQSVTHLLVSNLNPFCVYRLRLAAINKIGLGEFSDWIRAKTDEAPPGGSASKIVAAATGPNSIKVTWSPPDRRAWNGQLIGFNIGYRPIDSTFELNKTIEWLAPSLHSMVLDVTRNKQLSSSASSSSTKTTSGQHQKAADQPDPPSLDNKQHSTASERPPSNSSNSNTSADQRYSLRQHLRQLLALQQQELVAHLTNLQRATTYLLWIQAINSRGVSPQSHAVSVKTLDDVPPSAPAIKIQATSVSSITIAWSMLSNFVSSANQYSLFYRKAAQLTQSPPSRPNAAGGNFSSEFVVDSQQPAYGSHLRQNQNLLLVDDQQPQPFIERSITSQQLTASGSLNSMLIGGGGDGDYGEHGLAADKYLHQGSQQQQQHYQQFVYTLDQLDCGSVYELYMSTRNSVGKSEPSAMISTRTLGEPPLAPMNKNNFFSKIGINEVALNLAAWSTGGCPITHMTVRYKQSPMPVASASASASVSTHHHQNTNTQPSGNLSTAADMPSISVSWPITTSVPVSLLNALNNHQQQTSRSHYLSSDAALLHNSNSPLKNANESPVYYLKNLIPSSCYELEVLAYNTAGHTSAQYEFVTSNLNGTRAGYSRREPGIYRIEQATGSSQHDLASDGSARASIEQQMQAYKQASSGQILPLLLVTLCFVCLIISSVFCYTRLAGSWKQRGRRRNSNDTSSMRAGGHGPTNSSPGSIGGKSSMWGTTTLGDNRYLPVSAGHLQQPTDGSGCDQRSDSPITTLHYCMRDPLGGQPTLSATLNAKSIGAAASSFSQSVSMKDFNLPASTNSTVIGSKLPTGTATLNYKNYRATMHHPNDYKTTTLRARLFSEQPLNGLAGQTFLGQHQDGQLGGCHASSMCKRAANSNLRDNNNNNYVDMTRNGTQLASAESNGNTNQVSSSSSDPYSTHQFNYTQDNHQLQQETSWTNHYHPQCSIEQQTNGAAYAVPTAAANCANEQLNSNSNSNYGSRLDQIETQVDEANQASHHQSSIDACIQQLIGQQYQQQPYSMVMNFKPDRSCLYDTAKAVGQLLDGNQNAMGQVLKSQQQQQQQQTVACPAPFMDSSSSSSGIDIGGHLECASTTTGTSNSNTSNDAYHNQHQQNHLSSRPSHFNNGSEFSATEQQYSLQNVMQQFNEPT